MHDVLQKHAPAHGASYETLKKVCSFDRVGGQAHLQPNRQQRGDAVALQKLLLHCTWHTIYQQYTLLNSLMGVRSAEYTCLCVQAHRSLPASVQEAGGAEWAGVTNELGGGKELRQQDQRVAQQGVLGLRSWLAALCSTLCTHPSHNCITAVLASLPGHAFMHYKSSTDPCRGAVSLL